MHSVFESGSSLLIRTINRSVWWPVLRVVCYAWIAAQGSPRVVCCAWFVTLGLRVAETVMTSGNGSTH